jgi:hypothetical protein
MLLKSDMMEGTRTEGEQNAERSFIDLARQAVTGS